MNTHRRLRIALLTHSTNPRGGVVHALQLGEALTDLGHDVVVHAPDARKEGFFRKVRCGTALIPARPVTGGLGALVGTRIDEYVRYFSRRDVAAFDIYHAHDGIGANALATLAEWGRIPGFVRTVHHLDTFQDDAVEAWQLRGVGTAGKVLCVSRLWRALLREDFGIDALQVDNGVDTGRFTPQADATDAEVRALYGLGPGPVFLAVGGVEARKNTVRALQAFAWLRPRLPDAQLVIAGGASLLDHGAYRATFDEALAISGLATGPGEAVVLTGVVRDAHMPALYRCASALVVPSLTEGFGLAVLEAMASGVPAVVSRIEPFTEYLREGDCSWVDPFDVASIAAGMERALSPEAVATGRAAGAQVCAEHTWGGTATRHVLAYREFIARREVIDTSET
jgi:glycosyltransferase-like protein